MKLIFGASFFIVGQIIGWFSMNSQFISEFWKERALLSAISMGIPTSVCFWYAYRIIVEATGSAWTARFIGSSAGLIVFPILTWCLLGETMFTAKTMICLSLAILIILIQIFY